MGVPAARFAVMTQLAPGTEVRLDQLAPSGGLQLPGRGVDGSVLHGWPPRDAGRPLDLKSLDIKQSAMEP